MKIRKAKNKIIITVITLLVMLSIGWFIANRVVKRNGYTGVTEVIRTYFEHKKLADKVKPLELNIKISKSDFEFIRQKREIALNRGLQINEGENYVPCSLNLNGEESSEGEIRLKGHMTDHLEGNKWSFRIKSKDRIMNMYRFSIQHPGTRNYVYEWIYHQLLKQEGIIYLNYDFIKVNLNGESLGIYAVEEHFGQHVLEHNDRPKGAMLRWNPNLYWEWRIDEFQGVYLDEAYSAYASSFAEPYDKGVVRKDQELIKTYQTGAWLLEQFRRGELSTSQVFDVNKMAIFHVVIDLVGGYHSLDWSDVKFYYNSETKKIEPVGYESFSIRKTERIAGQRIQKNYDANEFEYHNQLFADPVFFEAYIKNLERIVDEAYLNQFFKSIRSGLDEKIGIIADEWAYRKFSLEGYYENVRLIRNNISLPKPFHAFLESSGDSVLNISVSPVSDYPIQIIGLKRNDKVRYLNEVINLKAKARLTYTHYFDYSIPNPFKKDNDIFLLAKIPGGSSVFEVVLNQYPSYRIDESQAPNDSSELLIDTTSMFLKGKTVMLKSKQNVIKTQTIIPKGYELVVYPGQEIALSEANQIKIYGSCNLNGGTGNQAIKISSQGDGSMYIYKGNLNAIHVQFSRNVSIQSKQSRLTFNKCVVYDMENTFIDDYHSDIVFYKGYAANIKQFAWFNETNLNIESSDFNNGKILFKSNGSLIGMSDSRVKNFDKVGELDYSSQFTAARTEFVKNDTLAELSKASTFNTFGGYLSSVKLAFLINKNEHFAGESVYSLYKTKESQIQQLEKSV